MTNSTTGRKIRNRPIHAAVKQMRWLIWASLSSERCCFCDALMFDSLDLKTCNQVTLHHLDGDKSTDDYTKICPRDRMLFAHSACHKAYHLMGRMQEQGKNINKARLNSMQRCCDKHARRMNKIVNGRKAR